MTGNKYTVASNEQLLGGNLRKACKCDDEIAEASIEALEQVDISAPEPASQSPADSFNTVSTGLIDLYARSSWDTIQSINTAELIDAFPDPPSPALQSSNTDPSALLTRSSESSNDHSMNDLCAIISSI